MKKQPDSTPQTTPKPEIDISSLQDMFDEKNNIDEIESNINAIDQKLLDQNFERAKSALSVWDLNQAKEISEVLKTLIPRDDTEAREAYKQIQNDIASKLVDEKIQEAITLYEKGELSEALDMFENINPQSSKQQEIIEKTTQDIKTQRVDKEIQEIIALYEKGEFLKAKSAFKNTHRAITHEQSEIIKKYQTLLQEKQKEMDKQQQEANKQEFIQTRKNFPVFLTTQSTVETDKQIDDFQKTLNTLEDKSFVEKFNDFPDKEIYETLQDFYLKKDMETFKRILRVNNCICDTISNIRRDHAKTKEEKNIQTKKIEEVLGIVPPLLGIWKPRKLPMKKNTIIKDIIMQTKNAYKADIFLDKILQKENIGEEKYNNRDWYRSKDWKYICMGIEIRYERRNLDRYIYKTWVHMTYSLKRMKSGSWINSLKKYLKGKYITSRTDTDGKRRLEVIE